MGGVDTPFELHVAHGYQPDLEDLGRMLAKLEKVLGVDRLSLMYQEAGGLRVTIECGDAVRRECYRDE